MHESRNSEYNDIKDSIERFELMEKGTKNFFFDVDSIEEMFEYYFDQFEIDKAKKILNIGLNQHPESIALQLKSAYLLMEEEEYETAVQKLEELSHFEPDNEEIYLNLGISHFYIDNPEKIISNLDKALELVEDEGLEEMLLEISSFFNLNEEFQITVKYLEPHYDKFCDNYHYLFELAFAYANNNFTDKAIEIYNYILEDNPFLENIWFSLGSAYLINLEYEKAIEAFEFVLAIEPEHGAVHLGLSQAYLFTEQLDKALDNILEYISHENDPLAYETAATLFIRLDKKDEAIKLLKLATKKFPHNIPVWIMLIHEYIDESTEEALDISIEAIRNNRKSDVLWYMNAKLLFELSYFDACITALETVITYNPHNIDAMKMFVDIMLFESETFKNANELLPKLEKLYPNSAIQFLFVAHYLFDNRNLKKAGLHLEKALNDPKGDILNFFLVFPDAFFEIKKSIRLTKIVSKYNKDIINDLSTPPNNDDILS